MSIILSMVNDNDNVINKIKTNQLTVNAKIPVNIDNQNPVIILSGDVDYSSYNYMDIPALGRSYFVECERVNSSMVKLYCRIDLLGTYKDDILASNARIKRGIKTGDYFDGSIDTSTLTTVNKYVSDKGFIEGESSIIFTTLEV